MIKATFFEAQGDIRGFELSGHAMFDVEGPDIVCAAVTAMTNLVINTLTEVFKADLATRVDGDTATIRSMLDSVSLKEESAVVGVMKGFMLQLKDLQEQYPDNLEVTIQQNITKGN